MISSRRCIAIAATAAVVAVPSSAQAMRSSDGPAPSRTPVRIVVHAPVAHAVTRPAARSGASASPATFRWEDAGLGAAGMLVLLGSTSLAARRLRPHRPITG